MIQWYKGLLFINTTYNSTLSLKRNATFWKLPFFWRRVYTRESGVIHHFDNAHGNNLPKTHDPGSHDPDPGPQEKSTKKSCVSFETECSSVAG